MVEFPPQPHDFNWNYHRVKEKEAEEILRSWRTNIPLPNSPKDICLVPSYIFTILLRYLKTIVHAFFRKDLPIFKFLLIILKFKANYIKWLFHIYPSIINVFFPLDIHCFSLLISQWLYSFICPNDGCFYFFPDKKDFNFLPSQLLFFISP